MRKRAGVCSSGFEDGVLLSDGSPLLLQRRDYRVRVLPSPCIEVSLSVRYSSIFSSGKAALWSDTSKRKMRLCFQATLARINHRGVLHYHQFGSDSMM